MNENNENLLWLAVMEAIKLNMVKKIVLKNVVGDSVFEQEIEFRKPALSTAGLTLKVPE